MIKIGGFVRKFLGVLAFVVFILPINVISSIYYSAGINYLIPTEKLKDKNKNSVGFKLEVMNKNYCRLWYGLRIDHFNLKKKDQVSYFKKETLISPVVKYSPFVRDCFDNKLLPYIEGQINMSSISGTDNLSKLGLGGGLGLGIAYNFKLFKKCWMIDAEALYSAPNFIYRADKRDNLKSINCGLSLSVSL